MFSRSWEAIAYPMDLKAEELSAGAGSEAGAAVSSAEVEVHAHREATEIARSEVGRIYDFFIIGDEVI